MPSQPAVHRVNPRSCRQDLVQFVDHPLEVVAEEGVDLTEPAPLGEGGIVEVVGLDGEVGGDVVANQG